MWMASLCDLALILYPDSFIRFPFKYRTAINRVTVKGGIRNWRIWILLPAQHVVYSVPLHKHIFSFCKMYLLLISGVALQSAWSGLKEKRLVLMVRPPSVMTLFPCTSAPYGRYEVGCMEPVHQRERKGFHQGLRELSDEHLGFVMDAQVIVFLITSLHDAQKITFMRTKHIFITIHFSHKGTHSYWDLWLPGLYSKHTKIILS